MGALTLMGVFIASLMIIGSQASVDITAAQSHSFGNDDIEFHFNRLNKPAIKSITLKDGDIIDCVDIYKQPAFDHPLLKNHTIRMFPSFVLEKENSNEPHMQPLWKESEGCPDGTVPIRRTQKAEISRAPSMGRFENFDTNGGTPERAGMYFDGSFNGVKTNISIEQPLVVEKNEWSHANIEISEGGRQKRLFIEAGWLVNRQLFGDAKTRLYTYWTADGYGASGCYNVLCPGFVQVSKKAVLGGQLGPISEFDGPKYVIQLTIHIDPEDLKWWLVVGDEPVGYWPQKLFDFKLRAAGTIQLAGSVLNMRNRNIHSVSFMGTGVRAFHGPRFAAFFGDLLVKKVGDDNYNKPDGNLLRPVSDNFDCYTMAIRPNENIPLIYGGCCN